LLLAAFSLPCFSEDAITPEQIRAWCQGKTPEELTGKLLWFGTIYNRLNLLYSEERTDAANTINALRNEIESATASIARSRMDFEILTTTQAARMTATNRERCLWRGGLLSVAGAGVGSLVGGVKGAAIGAGIGAAGGAAWWLVEKPP